MKRLNLFDVMQNSAISAIALHSFVLGFYKVAKNRRDYNLYPKLRQMFYVLPIVYNEYTREAVASSNQLYTAIHNNKGFVLGLQERANKMSIQTFDSLNLAFQKQVLVYNRSEESIELHEFHSKKKLPLPLIMDNSNNKVMRMQHSAYKLGGLFAKTDVKNLQIKLNIRF